MRSKIDQNASQKRALWLLEAFSSILLRSKAYFSTGTSSKIISTLAKNKKTSVQFEASRSLPNRGGDGRARAGGCGNQRPGSGGRGRSSDRGSPPAAGSRGRGSSYPQGNGRGGRGRDGSGCLHGAAVVIVTAVAAAVGDTAAATAATVAVTVAAAAVASSCLLAPTPGVWTFKRTRLSLCAPCDSAK